MQIAIDFGISNIDAVASIDGELRHWTQPAEGPPNVERVRAVLAAGGVGLASLREIAVTGGRHRLLPSQIDGCAIVGVAEIQAIGRGGRAMIDPPEAGAGAPILVVSAGSGTAAAGALTPRLGRAAGLDRHFVKSANIMTY